MSETLFRNSQSEAHLKSALDPGEREVFKEALITGCSGKLSDILRADYDLALTIDTVRPFFPDTDSASESVMGEILHDLTFADPSRLTEEGEIDFQLSVNFAMHLNNCIRLAVGDWGSVKPTLIEAVKWSNPDRVWDHLGHMHAGHILVVSLLDRMTTMNKYTVTPPIVQLTHNILVFVMRRQWILIKDLNYSHPLLVMKTQVQCLADTLYARVQSLTHLKLSEFTCGARLLPIPLLQTVYTWGDMVIKLHGNSGFSLLKLYEGLCIGRLNEVCDRFHTRSDYLSAIKKEFVIAHEKLPQVPCSCDAIFSTLNSIANRAWICELHAIFRHWGHPTVINALGVEKVKKIAHSRKPVSLQASMDLMGMFKRLLVLGYIKKHGRWPRGYFPDELSGTAQYTWCKEGIVTFDEYAEKCDFRAWAHFEVEKEADFETFCFYQDLLDDKAVGLPLSLIANVYEPNVLGFSPPDCQSESRRLLIKALRELRIDVSDICRMVQSRTVPRDWFAIGVMPKERELKIDPRLFALLPFHIRAFFATTERNVADHLMGVFEQQTITLSEPEIQARILMLTNPASHKKSCIRAFISLDFSSWNIRWSDYSMREIMRTIDQFFGTPGLQTFCHEYFQESTCYLISRQTPPSGIKPGLITELEDEFGKVWHDHRGGFEGHKQKPWALATICMIELGMFSNCTAGTITGQGDNVIVALDIPFPDNDPGDTGDAYARHSAYYDGKIRAFLVTLEEICRKLGQELKVEETWVSGSLFVYGKEVYVDGVAMPCVLKKISRMFEDTNDIVDTHDTALSSLASGSYAAAQKGFSWLVPITHLALETMLVTKKMVAPFCSSLITGSPMQQKAVMLFMRKLISILPSCLGGFPILSWVDYIFRGHPDPVTSALTGLQALAPHMPEARTILRYFDDEANVKSSTRELTGLIMDPTQLNLPVKSKVSGIIKRGLIELLQGPEVRNTEIQGLFHSRAQKEDEEVVQWICSTRPICPRVWSELWRCSIPGSRAALISCFGALRTLKQMMDPVKFNDLGRKAYAAERKRMRDLVCMVLKMMEYPPTWSARCTTRWADSLRTASHGLNSGEQIWGSTVPHPLEFLRGHDGLDCSHPLSESRISMIVGSCKNVEPWMEETGLPPVCISRGAKMPFLGARTAEKVTNRLVHFKVTERPVLLAMRLARSVNWISTAGSNFATCVREMVQDRTDIPFEIVQLLAGEISSGHVFHRLSDVVTKHAAYLTSRPNFSSYCALSSDEFHPYSASEDDYNMFFQGALLAVLGVVNEIQFFVQDPPKSWHFTIGCPLCIQKLEDVRMETEVSYPKLSVSGLTTAHITPVTYLERFDSTVALTQLPIMSQIEYLTPEFGGQAIGALIAQNSGISCRSSVHAMTGFALTSFIERPRVQELMYVGLDQVLKGVVTQILIRDLPDALIRATVRVGPNLPEARRARNISPDGEVPHYNLTLKQWREYRTIFTKERKDYKHPDGPFLGVESSLAAMIMMNPMIWWSPIADMVPLLDPKDPKNSSLRDVLTHSYLSSGGGSATCQALSAILSRRLRSILDEVLPLRDGLILVGSHSAITALPRLIINAIVLSRTTPLRDPGILMCEFLEWRESCESKRIKGASYFSLDALIKYMASCGVDIREFTTICAKSPGGFLRTPKADDILTAPKVIRTLAAKPIQRAEMIWEWELDNFRRPTALDREISLTTTTYQDPTYRERIYRDHKYRLSGELSTSPYKYADIMLYLGIDLHGTKVLCAAEGAGGVAALLVVGFRADQVVFNTLYDLTDVAEHRHSGLKPQECLRIGVEEQIITPLEGLIDNGNLMSGRVVRTLSSHGPYGFSTCDIEFSSSTLIADYLAAIGGYLTVLKMSLAEEGSAVLKTYLEHGELFCAVVSMCFKVFSRVTVVTPSYSSYETSEVFLCLRSKHSRPFACSPHHFVRPTAEYLLNFGLCHAMRSCRLSSSRPLQELKPDPGLAAFIRRIFGSNKQRAAFLLTNCTLEPTPENLGFNICRLNSLILLRREVYIARVHVPKHLPRSAVQEFTRGANERARDEVYANWLLNTYIVLFLLDHPDEMTLERAFNYGVDSFSHPLKPTYVQWLHTSGKLMWRLYGHLTG